MVKLLSLFLLGICFQYVGCRDEERIMKACYWPNEVYEPCFGGCAEVSCDNPRNHMRPCYPYCEPGCICEEPYVRDDRTHQCVLPHDCSPSQMGIPLHEKRSRHDKPGMKYDMRQPRTRHDELLEDELSLNNLHMNSLGPMGLNKRPTGSDMSRMGNYFNIVIAPPPIKTLQPRKLLQSKTSFQ